MKEPFPINESFTGMLESIRETGDMVLELRSEEYHCHKIVITATSEYFKKALKENMYINKYKYHMAGPFKQRLIVPDWIDPRALKLFINYCYTGRIGNCVDPR